MKPPATKEKEKARKLTWKEERELEGMEALIAEREAEHGKLENGWADPEYCAHHAAQLAAEAVEGERLKAEIQRLYARWESLEALKVASV